MIFKWLTWPDAHACFGETTESCYFWSYKIVSSRGVKNRSKHTVCRPRK